MGIDRLGYSIHRLDHISLLSRSQQGLSSQKQRTIERSKGSSQVRCKCKEAKSSRLCLSCAVFWNHGSYGAIAKSVSLHHIFSIKHPETYTIVPANTPVRHRNKIICHIVLLKPNSVHEIATPVRENTSVGFLPKRSDAFPHEIMNIICVNENSDS